MKGEKMEDKKIIFFADSIIPEGISPEKREEFTYYAAGRLCGKFLRHKVELADIVWTDDEENRKNIADFCHNLWDEFCSLK